MADVARICERSILTSTRAIGNLNSGLMRIIPISVPTPFYIGPVNVYLIAEDPITIIDTGPKTKEAIEALRAGLRTGGLPRFRYSPHRADSRARRSLWTGALTAR